MIAGTEEQKQRYLPGIAKGTHRAAFCLSEPGAGSDVAGMQTRARDDGDGGYVLNGTKCWISGGMQADWFVVFAKTGDPASRVAHEHRRVHRRGRQRRRDAAARGQEDGRQGHRHDRDRLHRREGPGRIR